MKKRNHILLGTLLFCSLVLGGSAFALSNQHPLNMGLQGAEHTAACPWNHYDAVAATATTHGSKEFWACCVHHEFVLEAPSVGTVTDKGAFTGEYFDNLDPSDERYIAPLGAHAYTITINDGDPIALTDFTSTLTDKDTCVARFGLDGLKMKRGDRYSFYKDGEFMSGMYAEEGSNLQVRSTADVLLPCLFTVQTPGEDLSVHLNLYGDGSAKAWAGGYDARYLQFLYLIREEKEYYIDFNLRLDEEWPSPYSGKNLPMGWLHFNLKAGDEFRIVRERWWMDWSTQGDGWAYMTSKGGSDYDMRIAQRGGLYYFACNGFKGYGEGWKDIFQICTMEKDLYVNYEKVSRKNYIYDGDQVQVQVELKKGDIIYMRKDKVDGTGEVLGWYQLDGGSDTSFLTRADSHIEILRDGTYYIRSWYSAIFVELRASTWVTVINGEETGYTPLNPDNKYTLSQRLTLKAGDHLYFKDTAKKTDNRYDGDSLAVDDDFYWSYSRDKSYADFVFDVDEESRDLVAKKDATVRIWFNPFHSNPKNLLVLVDRAWTLEVNGAEAATATTVDKETTISFENVHLQEDDAIRIFDDFGTREYGYDDIRQELGGGLKHFSRGLNGEMVVKDDGIYSFTVDVTTLAYSCKSVEVHEADDTRFTPGTEITLVGYELPDIFTTRNPARVFLLELYKASTAEEAILGEPNYVITAKSQNTEGNHAGWLDFYRFSNIKFARIFYCEHGTIEPDLSVEEGPGRVYYYTEGALPANTGSKSIYNMGYWTEHTFEAA